METNEATNPYPTYAAVLGQLPAFEPDLDRTALLVIDIQYMCAHPEYGTGPSMTELLPDRGEYYFNRLAETVLPNTAKLIAACRERDIPIIHSRNAAPVPGSREVPWRRRFIAPEVIAGSKEAEFLDEVAPLPTEIVLNKTTASVFNSTVVEFYLRNMGVDTLIVAGVVTNMCVESSVRDGGDRGFQILLVEDACAAMSQAEHDNAVAFLHRRFANAVDAQQALDWISVPAAAASQSEA